MKRKYKKKLIIPSLIIIVLIGAGLLLFTYFHEFNTLKPLITRAVKQATGRDLVINGDIHVIPSWPPAVTAEDVAFENASWGSSPYMAKAKKLTVSMRLLPILRGEYRLASIHLAAPEVELEFDEQGRFNWVFETGDDSTASGGAPVMAFNDIHMQKGRCRIRDPKKGLDLTLTVNELRADIDGLEHPIQIDAHGMLMDRPFEIQGSFGPIMAWIKPDQPLQLDLKAGLGEIIAQLKGPIQDPLNFEKFSLTFKATGPSTREAATIAGLTKIPEFGFFDVEGELNDPMGRLAIRHLRAAIGSPQTVQFTASGSAGDLMRLEDIDLGFHLQSDSTTRLETLGIPVPPDYGPIDISGTLSTPGKKRYLFDKIKVAAGAYTLSGHVDLNIAGPYPVWDAAINTRMEAFGTLTCATRMSGPFQSIRVDKIELKLEDGKGTKAYLSGAVSNLNQMTGVDLKLNAYGEALTFLENMTGRPAPVRGPYTVAAKLTMPDRNLLQVPEIKIIVGGTRLRGSLDLDLSGETARLKGTFDSGRLDLKTILARHLLSEQLAEDLGLIGPTHLDFLMTGPLARPELNRIAIQTAIADLADLKLNGAIGDLRRLNHMDLSFSASGKRLQNLEKISGHPMPFPGPFSISGKLINAEGKNYRFENLEAAAGMNTMTGGVTIDLEGREPVVTAVLEIPGLTLQALSMGPNPILDGLKARKDLGQLKLKARLVKTKNSIAFKNLDFTAGDEDLVRIQIQGSTDDILTRKNLALNLQASGSDITHLAAIIGRDVPLRGAYALSFKVSEHEHHNFLLSDLDFSIGGTPFNGWVNLNLADKHPVVETELSSDRIGLEPFTHASLDPFRGIRDPGPLDLAAKLAWTDKSISIRHIDFKIGRPESAALQIDGTVQSLKPLENVDLDFSLVSDDPASLGNLYGSRYFDRNPIRFSGHLGFARIGHYKISKIRARHGSSDISGSVAIDLRNGTPAIEAELSSRKLDLRPIRKAFFEHNPHFGKQQHNPPPKGRIFPDQPFSTGILNRMDAYVDFKSQELLAHNFAFNDVSVGFHLHNGDLDLTPLNFTIGGGSADGQLTLNSENGSTFLKTELDVNQFDIGPMLEQLGLERNIEGTMNASFDLSSTGSSIAALMAGLGGSIHLSLDDGQVQNKQLAMLERYLGSHVLDLVNPFKVRSSRTKINCLINTIDIDGGIADYKLAMDMDQSALFAAGTIDLRDETLNIAVKPTPKSGFGDNNVGSISFSLSQLSQPFGLGGTLAKPQITLDAARTALTAGKIAAALTLGPYGITLLFTDISIGKKDICTEIGEKILPLDIPEPQR